jgi:hypothetical protein
MKKSGITTNVHQVKNNDAKNYEAVFKEAFDFLTKKKKEPKSEFNCPNPDGRKPLIKTPVHGIPPRRV